MAAHRNVLLAVASALALGLAPGCGLGGAVSDKARDASYLATRRELRSGEEKSDVRAAWGPPDRVSRLVAADGREAEVWEYDGLAPDRGVVTTTLTFDGARLVRVEKRVDPDASHYPRD